MYCIKFGPINGIKYGFIKPYNAVRDSKTYSLTYIIPSMIDGIIHEHGLKGKILRHKLTFEGMTTNDFKKCHVFNDLDKNAENGVFTEVIKSDMSMNTHERHSLINPTLTLAFESKEDAEQMYTETIYIGQSEYFIYPVEFFEATDEEFNQIEGVESFATDEDDECGFYCGNNRLKDNQPMYIKIDRKEWRK